MTFQIIMNRQKSISNMIVTGKSIKKVADYINSLIFCGCLFFTKCQINQELPPTIQDKAEFQNEGLLCGTFSVADNVVVHFSQGNLQYQASTETWRFASNQYDVIGSSNSSISTSYDGWIDLFGWGTGDNPTLASLENSDYSTFVDWGRNQISNGGNQANLWHTLTKEEWKYLFYERDHAKTLFGMGKVNDVNGIIILPDKWEAPAGLTFIASTTLGLEDLGEYFYNANGSHFLDNAYTSLQWYEMEEAGAVFLPAIFYRVGANIPNDQDTNLSCYFFYWSSTPNGTERAYDFVFNSLLLNLKDSRERNWGLPVRLVR